jgi:uncharacterized protein
MRKKIERVIIDTNLWISFLITKKFEKLGELIFLKESVLLFSQELLDELLGVARRQKFRRYFPEEYIEEILETIHEYAEFIKVETEIEICRDPKDNFLLSLSIDGQADFLITGDSDLLHLRKFGQTLIVTISEFLKMKH